jgi:hypothetical protein
MPSTWGAAPRRLSFTPAAHSGQWWQRYATLLRVDGHSWRQGLICKVLIVDTVVHTELHHKNQKSNLH